MRVKNEIDPTNKNHAIVNYYQLKEFNYRNF